MKSPVLIILVLLFPSVSNGQTDLYNEVKGKSLKGKVKTMIVATFFPRDNGKTPTEFENENFPALTYSFSEKGIVTQRYALKFENNKRFIKTYYSIKFENDKPVKGTYRDSNAYVLFTTDYKQTSDTSYAIVDVDNELNIMSGTLISIDKSGRIAEETEFKYDKDGNTEYFIRKKVYSNGYLSRENVEAVVEDKKTGQKERVGNLTIEYTIQQTDEHGNPTLVKAHDSNGKDILRAYTYEYYQ